MKAFKVLLRNNDKLVSLAMMGKYEVEYKKDEISLPVKDSKLYVFLDVHDAIKMCQVSVHEIWEAEVDNIYPCQASVLSGAKPDTFDTFWKAYNNGYLGNCRLITTHAPSARLTDSVKLIKKVYR